MLTAGSMVIPAAGPATNSSVFSVVRLYTTTEYPWSAMFMARF